MVNSGPTSLGQLNNYGICIGCHTNNADPNLNITVFHARPDKNSATWYMFNGEIYLGDGGRCTGTIGLNPDAPIAYGYARYAPGRSTGTIGKFNLHKVPGFGYDPGPSDAEACSDEGNFDSSPWNFTLINVPAQLTGGPATVPVFSSLLRRTSAGIIGAPSPGTYTHTFEYTGAVETLPLPDTATNIQFTVKSGGGGGGRPDNEGTETAGQPGRMVTTFFPDTVTIGTTNLKIYVGGGGKKASDTWEGAPGGFGYTASGYPKGIGYNGFDGEYWADNEYAFGGAGGGGASAIIMNENNSTILASAVGGQGGNSSDWYYTGLGDILAGGLGGWGGGTDIYPGGTRNLTGGGCGGDTLPSDGCNGEVIIYYEIP